MYKIINRRKKVIVQLFDKIGMLIFRLHRLLRAGRRGRTTELDPSRIVIVRFAYIGDLILTLPVFKPLREHFPQSHITLLTSSMMAPLVEGNPYIDEVMTYDAPWFYGKISLKTVSNYFSFLRSLRSRNFTLGIDTRADIRNIFFVLFLGRVPTRLSFGFGGGAYMLTDVVGYHRIRHKVDLHLDLLGYLGIDTRQTPQLTIFLTEEERREAREILTNARSTDDALFIAIHPGARVHLKRWSIKNYARLCRKLLETYNVSLVLLGDKSEEKLFSGLQNELGNDCHSLIGKLTLRQLLAVIDQCSMLICNDSAPMHMGVALNTPTVTVFGPSKSLETGPYHGGHAVVEKNFTCRYDCDETHCNYGQYKACLKAVSVDDVFRKIELLMTEHDLLRP